MIFKVFLAGWIVLVVAIILNYIAIKFGLTTWYDFAGIIGKHGLIEAVKRIGVVSVVFLLVVYPFVLGLAALFSLRFLK